VCDRSQEKKREVACRNQSITKRIRRHEEEVFSMAEVFYANEVCVTIHFIVSTATRAFDRAIRSSCLV